jgi:hypothetical protein
MRPGDCSDPAEAPGCAPWPALIFTPIGTGHLHSAAIDHESPIHEEPLHRLADPVEFTQRVSVEHDQVSDLAGSD